MPPASRAKQSSPGADHRDRSEMTAEQTTSLKRHYQKQKNQAIDLLTHSIAHDLNNTLASVLGFSDLALKRSSADPKQQQYIEEVKLAALRAKALALQLQSCSQPDVHHQTSIQTIDFLTPTIERIRSELPASIELSVSTVHPFPELQLDPNQITQALEQILANSLEAIEDNGHIMIDLRTQVSTKATCASCYQVFSGSFVEISIRDDGSGICSHDKERLFDPCFSAWNLQPGHKSRSGMGLAIAHGIVHAHQGHLLLDSAPAQGCCIKVLLPITGPIENLQRQQALPTTSPPSPTRMSSIQPADERDSADPALYVMVVDDDAGVGAFFRNLLTGVGYQVELFSDSNEALQHYQQDPDRYRLVVTDHKMPGLSGIELINAIKALRPHVPVIMCTGYSAQIDKDFAASLQINFLPKPLEKFSELTTLAKSLLA